MTTCPVCGAALVEARTDDGASLLLEATPSYARGSWDLVLGGSGGVPLARPPRPSARSIPRLLYADHTVCPVPH